MPVRSKPLPPNHSEKLAVKKQLPRWLRGWRLKVLMVLSLVIALAIFVRMANSSSETARVSSVPKAIKPAAEVVVNATPVSMDQLEDGLQMTVAKGDLPDGSTAYEPFFNETPAATFAAKGNMYHAKGITATGIEISDEDGNTLTVPVGHDVYLNGVRLGTVAKSSDPHRVKFIFAKVTDMLFAAGGSKQPIGLALKGKYLLVDFQLDDPATRAMSVHYLGSDGSQKDEPFIVGEGSLLFILWNDAQGPDTGVESPYLRITLPGPGK